MKLDTLHQNAACVTLTLNGSEHTGTVSRDLTSDLPFERRLLRARIDETHDNHGLDTLEATFLWSARSSLRSSLRERLKAFFKRKLLELFLRMTAMRNRAVEP
jgi:hypothetical protein